MRSCHDTDRTGPGGRGGILHRCADRQELYQYEHSSCFWRKKVTTLSCPSFLIVSRTKVKKCWVCVWGRRLEGECSVWASAGFTQLTELRAEWAVKPPAALSTNHWEIRIYNTSSLCCAFLLSEKLTCLQSMGGDYQTVSHITHAHREREAGRERGSKLWAAASGHLETHRPSWFQCHNCKLLN